MTTVTRMRVCYQNCSWVMHWPQLLNPSDLDRRYCIDHIFNGCCHHYLSVQTSDGHSNTCIVCYLIPAGWLAIAVIIMITTSIIMISISISIIIIIIIITILILILILILVLTTTIIILISTYVHYQRTGTRREQPRKGPTEASHQP